MDSIDFKDKSLRWSSGRTKILFRNSVFGPSLIGIEIKIEKFEDSIIMFLTLKMVKLFANTFFIFFQRDFQFLPRIATWLARKELVCLSGSVWKVKENTSGCVWMDSCSDPVVFTATTRYSSFFLLSVESPDWKILFTCTYI